jgi:hypothetical protein
MDEIQLELNKLRNKYNSTVNENIKLDIKRKMTELNKEFILLRDINNKKAKSKTPQPKPSIPEKKEEPKFENEELVSKTEEVKETSQEEDDRGKVTISGGFAEQSIDSINPHHNKKDHNNNRK